MNNQSMILFCDSSSGVFIPQRFANEINRDFLHNVTSEDLEALQDPDCEFYWDTWNHLLDNAVVIDENGNEYTLFHDGDLWLLCYELLTDDEKISLDFL